ncbi:MAG: hypothetical protein QOD81_2105 [Solirubrobacteraceae bacterium]|nr:hypothetical protein [Solirubrobacteraceae bacterium]
MRLTAEQARSRRVRGQRLHERAPRDAMLGVAGALCGVHAQLMSSAELALWARVEGLRPGDLGRALWEERTLVRTWAVRGTLHLLPASEFGLWLAALGTYRHYLRPSWFKAFGISPEELEALIAAVSEALRDRTLTRTELAVQVTQVTGSPELSAKLEESWGAYLKPAAFQGHLCFAPSAGQNVRFTHPSTWLAELEIADPGTAVAEVTRRYLHAYGPASREDYGRWWGISPAEALTRLRALGDELTEVDVDGRRGFMLAADAAEAAGREATGSVRLLPAFDPYVVGSSRDDVDVLAAEHKARVHRPQGWISPVLLVEGRIEGVWRHERGGGRLAVEIRPFGAPGDDVRAAAEAEARRLSAFLGGELELTWS